MRDGLFRKVALDRQSSPERLDELMQLTGPGGWLALLAACVVVAVAVGWGILGRVPTVVAAEGVLIRDESIRMVESPGTGQVADVLVDVGDPVTRDQVVARLVQSGTGRTVDVASAHDGRVTEVRAERGNVVQAGTSLLVLEQEGRPLEAVLYLPPIEAKRVQPGMEVQLAPSSVRQERYGLLRGRVTTVGELPATLLSMRRVLGSDELARALHGGGTGALRGAPIQVEVELLRDERTASGFQWTSPGGPPIAIQNGTPCTAEVVLAEQAPIALVFAGAGR
jgi:hypothetical protein